MKCIFCEHKETEVVNSRKYKNNNSVWRRRKCLKCEEIFTTEENISHDVIFLVKRNLSRKKFVYEKLFSSILEAIQSGKRRDRGDEATLAKNITREVIKELLKGNNSKYLSTKQVVITTHNILTKENKFFADRYAMFSDFRLKTVKGFNK